MKHTKRKWPDNIRLEMIEKSEFYTEYKTYQYGYYDGWQKAQKQNSDLLEALKELTQVFKQIAKGPFDELDRAEQAITNSEK